MTHNPAQASTIERKFQNGDKVIAGYLKLEMVVVNATLCLKGWRYKLAFPKKDGTPHKGRIPLFYFEHNIKSIN